uniref:Secreted protein n=1 Tax=Triticum urartu TaxID=4572 RepID=A0A8R7P9B3_TRIUA
MAHRWMMKLLMWPSVPQTTRCTLPVQLVVASPPFLSWIRRGASLAIGPEKKVTREGTDYGRVFRGGSKSNCHLLALLILGCRIAGPIVESHNHTRKSKQPAGY